MHDHLLVGSKKQKEQNDNILLGALMLCSDLIYRIIYMIFFFQILAAGIQNDIRVAPAAFLQHCLVTQAIGAKDCICTCPYSKS